MSDDIGLNQAEQDERELQIAVANAQRLMHDEGLQMFLTAQRKIGEHHAVYSETPDQREVNRIKVVVIDELRGLLEATARVNEDRIEEAARDRAME